MSKFSEDGPTDGIDSWAYVDPCLKFTKTELKNDMNIRREKFQLKKYNYKLYIEKSLSFLFNVTMETSKTVEICCLSNLMFSFFSR